MLRKGASRPDRDHHDTARQNGQRSIGSIGRRPRLRHPERGRKRRQSGAWSCRWRLWDVLSTGCNRQRQYKQRGNIRTGSISFHDSYSAHANHWSLFAPASHHNLRPGSARLLAKLLKQKPPAPARLSQVQFRLQPRPLVNSVVIATSQWCARTGDRALDAQRIFELANRVYSQYVSQNPVEKAKLLRMLFFGLLWVTKASVRPHAEALRRQACWCLLIRAALGGSDRYDFVYSTPCGSLC